MVTKINFHIHSTGSDGKLTPEQVIQEAIKDGIHFMCFTDHYKVPKIVRANPNGPEYHPLIYLEEVIKLQKQYADKIDISFGAEFDWLENHLDWIKQEIIKGKYDYLIGSVHGIIHSSKFYTFWDKKEDRDTIVNELGGKKEYVQEYYRQLRLMVGSGLFDCVGHLDIVKLNNKDNELFSEDEDWYKQEIEKTLNEIKKSRMTIEINTRGILARGEGKQYPSLWILEEARKKNIPITIGTDSHNSGQNEPFLEKAYNLARQAGYTEIVRFKKRKPIKIVIDGN